MITTYHQLMLLLGGSLVHLERQLCPRALVQLLLLLLRKDNRSRLHASHQLLLHVKIQPVHVCRLTRVYTELAHQILVHQVLISLAVLLNMPRLAGHEALSMLMQGRRMLCDVHAHIVCLDLSQIIRLLVLR